MDLIYLPRESRQGTLDPTGWVQVPSSARRLSILGDINPLDLIDLRNSFSIRVEWSPDGGTTVRPWAGYFWRSDGLAVRRGGLAHANPVLTIAPPPPLAMIRALLSLGRECVVGYLVRTQNTE